MPTDPKTIHSFDRYAKEWVKRIEKGENFFHRFLEKPAMFAKIPHIKGRVVLDIGCGTGEVCAHLKSLGAKRVIGIDLSKKFLEMAGAKHKGIEFYQMDMEKIRFPKNTFDFIASSLALHYVKDWRPVLKNIYRMLKPEGIFLFSTHHPITWGAFIQKQKDKEIRLMGYENNGPRSKIYGDYLNVRKVQVTLFEELKVTYYHKPFSNILRDIRESGFIISDFVEPKPTRGMKKRKPILWRIHQKIPFFMIFELRKVYEHPKRNS